jgi:hypothetical protein
MVVRRATTAMATITTTTAITLRKWIAAPPPLCDHNLAKVVSRLR